MQKKDNKRGRTNTAAASARGSAQRGKQKTASAQNCYVPSRKKRTAWVAAQIAISAVLLAAVHITVVQPILRDWNKVESMAGSTWLEENAVNMPASTPSGETDPAEPTTEPTESEAVYDSVSVNNTEIYNGDLILVNGDLAYQSTDESELKTVYGNKSDSYHVSGSELMLRAEVIDHMNTMLDEFRTATGHDDIIIISGYRTQEKQQELYDADLEATGSQTSTLVAKPGYSEHQTGYAVDFSLFDGMNSADYDGTGEYAWINENIAHYGFILRYPEDKTEITNYQYESWHYRYVGQPHAFYMQQNNLCLEEYIERLKTCTLENMLEVINWDGKVYNVYYVPAEAGDTTYVMVPPNTEYTISGNNADGFIVTVDTGVTDLDALDAMMAAQEESNKTESDAEPSDTEAAGTDTEDIASEESESAEENESGTEDTVSE